MKDLVETHAAQCTISNANYVNRSVNRKVTACSLFTSRCL